jgi:hypothetical protein
MEALITDMVMAEAVIMAEDGKAIHSGIIQQYRM